MLPPEVVYDLAGILDISDKAFIVGGQALNLWAERYNAIPALEAYGPYTSKDIDYFGHREAAEKLAEALGGEVHVPAPGDHTFQTAMVVASVGGQSIEIDFIGHVKGVDDTQLFKQAVELRMKVRLPDERTGELIVPIMHPFHCLQSRLANVVDLERGSALAKNQLEASPIVLRAYLSELLDAGKHRHVTGVLQALHAYLKSDITGRKAHHFMANDPLEVLQSFREDERLDPRWRERSLAPMIEGLQSKREAAAARRKKMSRSRGR